MAPLRLSRLRGLKFKLRSGRGHGSGHPGPRPICPGGNGGDGTFVPDLSGAETLPVPAPFHDSHRGVRALRLAQPQPYYSLAGCCLRSSLCGARRRRAESPQLIVLRTERQIAQRGARLGRATISAARTAWHAAQGPKHPTEAPHACRDLTRDGSYARAPSQRGAAKFETRVGEKKKFSDHF